MEVVECWEYFAEPGSLESDGVLLVGNIAGSHS